MERMLVLVITGPVGAGKSTTAWEARELLGRHGVSNLLVDMDYLRMLYPEPPDDRFASAFGLRNLTAMWPNIQASNARVVIIPGVVESMTARANYEGAMPDAEVVVVRLDVPMATLHARLTKREAPDHLDWYLQRAPELQRIMERESVGDVVVPVAAEDTPQDVAKKVVSAIVTMYPAIAEAVGMKDALERSRRASGD